MTMTPIVKPDGRPLRLAGLAEAQQVLGVGRSATKEALARPDAPAPIVRLAATPVWDVDDLEAFAAIPRKPGPKPKPKPRAAAAAG